MCRGPWCTKCNRCTPKPHGGPHTTHATRTHPGPVKWLTVSLLPRMAGRSMPSRLADADTIHGAFSNLASSFSRLLRYSPSPATYLHPTSNTHTPAAMGGQLVIQGQRHVVGDDGCGGGGGGGGAPGGRQVVLRHMGGGDIGTGYRSDPPPPPSDPSPRTVGRRCRTLGPHQ